MAQHSAPRSGKSHSSGNQADTITMRTLMNQRSKKQSLTHLWLAFPLTIIMFTLVACGGVESKNVHIGSGLEPNSVNNTSPETSSANKNGQQYDADRSGQGSNAINSSGAEDTFPAVSKDGQKTGRNGRDIVRIATIKLVVASPEQSIEKLQQITENVEGYVENLATGNKSTLVTIRIPTDTYDTAMRNISELGEVIEVNAGAEDVTEQVVDLSARIVAQRESVIRVRQLMRQASDLSEILRVEQELANRQTQLESLVAQQNQLEKTVSLATITTTIFDEDPKNVQTSTPPRWWDTPWQLFGDSWKTILIVFAALSPLIILLGFAAAVITLVVRKRRKKSDSVESDSVESFGDPGDAP